MSKTKLVFLAMGNAIICAQAFLMIGMAMADSDIVLHPGMGALVAALVLFVTSGVNMTAIHELQKRAARRREAEAREAAAAAGAGAAEVVAAAQPVIREPLDVAPDILEAYSRETAEDDRILRTARLFRERMQNSPGLKDQPLSEGAMNEPNMPDATMPDETQKAGGARG